MRISKGKSPYEDFQRRSAALWVGGRPREGGASGPTFATRTPYPTSPDPESGVFGTSDARPSHKSELPEIPLRDAEEPLHFFGSGGPNPPNPQILLHA